MGRHQSEWPQLAGKRRAVHRICDHHFRFENPRIKFRQGENHSIPVLRFGDNVTGHRGTTELFALRNSGSVQEFFKEYALIRFLLLVVRIHNRKRFPRHFFQVGNG